MHPRALIMGTLGSAFPADRRLGEETGLTVPRQASNRTWIVDPLDGTVNFASGLPFWCVSIALAIDHRVVLGVIHDPLRNETVVATTGGGARRFPGGDRLELRRLRRSADAVVAGDPGSADDPEAQLRIARLRPQVRAVRALGSTALSPALVGDRPPRRGDAALGRGSARERQSSVTRRPRA